MKIYFVLEGVGGAASQGAYFAGAYNGSPFFGVQSNYQSSPIVITNNNWTSSFGAFCYKNSILLASDFVLDIDPKIMN